MTTPPSALPYAPGNWWEDTTGGLSLPDFPDGLDSDAWDPTSVIPDSVDRDRIG